MKRKRKLISYDTWWNDSRTMGYGDETYSNISVRCTRFAKDEHVYQEHCTGVRERKGFAPVAHVISYLEAKRINSLIGELSHGAIVDHPDHAMSIIPSLFAMSDQSAKNANYAFSLKKSTAQEPIKPITIKANFADKSNSSWMNAFRVDRPFRKTPASVLAVSFHIDKEQSAFLDMLKEVASHQSDFFDRQYRILIELPQETMAITGCDSTVHIAEDETGADIMILSDRKFSDKFMSGHRDRDLFNDLGDNFWSNPDYVWIDPPTPVHSPVVYDFQSLYPRTFGMGGSTVNFRRKQFRLKSYGGLFCDTDGYAKRLILKQRKMSYDQWQA